MIFMAHKLYTGIRWRDEPRCWLARPHGWWTLRQARRG